MATSKAIGPLAFFALVLVHAQDQHPRFDVASVKFSRLGSEAMGGTIGFLKGGRVSMENVTLPTLICIAYDVDEYKVSGGPSWINDVRYTIRANPANPVPIGQARLMLQTLLAETFNLRFHRQAIFVDGYSLSAPKGSAKLRKSAPDSGEGFGIMTNGKMDGTGIDMPSLAWNLKVILGTPVKDNTGISGKYDIKLEWVPNDEAPDARSIFAALKEDIGLTLRHDKVQIDKIVIDHAQREPIEK